MNLQKKLQFIFGIITLFIGFYLLSYTDDNYFIGVGFIIWGIGAVLLARLPQKGKNIWITQAISIAGSLLLLVGFLLNYSK